VDESLRLSPTASDPYRFIQAGGRDLFFDAQLSWKLDRLVFSGDELGTERLRRQREENARALVERVLKAFFAWHEALLRSRDPLLEPMEQELRNLEALQAAITLDVLTGGWFIEHAGRVMQR
jgi:hypothetical protein